MASFKEVIRALEGFCRLELAEAWDNVGLLVQPVSLWGDDGEQTPIDRVLVCVDLTLAALAEAQSLHARVIVAYHPVLFHPMKRLTPSAGTKQRIACAALEAGIAVFCPHSALDTLPGNGMNDWLIGALLARVPSATCEPLVKPQSPLLQQPGVGAGRIVRLPSDGAAPLTLRELVPLLRERMAPGAHVRVALGRCNGGGNAEDRAVRCIALCVGSGGDMLAKVAGTTADVLVTGEMTHHAVLDATERGATVVLSEHTATERGYLAGVLKPALDALLSTRGTEILISKAESELITLSSF